MKIKLTPGVEYIFNSIATYNKNKEIDLLEFTSDVMSAGFYNELIIGMNLWKEMIKYHNDQV